jgi:hypothetical protein
LPVYILSYEREEYLLASMFTLKRSITVMRIGDDDCTGCSMLFCRVFINEINKITPIIADYFLPSKGSGLTIFCIFFGM